MTHPALTAAVTAAREFADAMEAVHKALNNPEQEIKVGDTVIIREGFVAGVASSVVGRTGKVESIDVGYGRTRYTVDGCTAARVEKVSDDPTPEPTPTRVEIVTTDDDARLVAAEPGIHGDGSVFLWAKAYGDRVSAWLSRDEARQLAATLTKIADTP